MRRTYFGGNNVHGPARRLSAESFADLVARYFNSAIALPYTHAEFLAMAEDRQNEVKSVAYVTAASFRADDVPRKKENADMLQLACMDFDAGDEATRIFESPAVLSAQLAPYNFLLYTTARHTEARPRLRLIVDIEPMDLALHKAVIDHLASLLGIQKWKGIQESKIGVQPMYRPVRFKGEETSPVIACRLSGRALSMLEVPEEAIPDTTYSASIDGVEDIEFLPVADLTLEMVRGALEKISPDCGYHQWCEVACALRHQFRDEEEAREAFEAYDAWSSRGAKYRDREDTLTKWRSFRPVPTTGNPTTIRALFKFAIQGGWDPSPVAVLSVASFEEWLEGVKDAKTIDSEFASRIAGMPFRSPIQDKDLLNKVRKAYNKISGSNVPLATFESQLRQDTREVVLENPDEPPDWLRPFVFVNSSSQFVNTINMVGYRRENFDIVFGHHLMPTMAEVGGNGNPPTSASSYAAHVMKIRKVAAPMYDPRHAGAEPIYEKDGVEFLNTYRASYPEPDASTSAEAGAIFTRHLELLIREPEYAAVILDFCAFLVQKPGIKIRWAPVIQSVYGAGKGVIMKALEGALGRGNVKPVSNNQVRQVWNEWAQGCQLLVIEEMHASGQNRKEFMSSIKELLTNDDLPIARRGHDSYVVDNLVNVIGFTNELDALSIDINERRYMVIKSPLQNYHQTDALADSGYYIRGMIRLQDELAAGLRHFLLHHKISPQFRPNGPAPRTTYMTQMAEDSKNPVQLAIEEIVADDLHPLITRDAVFMRALTPELKRRGLGGRPSVFLQLMGYDRRENVRIDAQTGDLWVHRNWQDDMEGCPLQYLRNRAATMVEPVN